MKEQEKTITNAAEIKNIAMRISTTTVVVNLALSVFKLVAGLVASSGAMISDAIHSASDVISTFIVMIGVHISGKEPDKEHPYGHERFECVASIVLAMILAETGIAIGSTGMKTIISGNYSGLKIPGMLALVAAVISIIVKEWMYHYTIHAARRIQSGALKADAWHHRSDALSSIGALIGIAGARMGFAIADSIASVIICLFIIKAAYDIFKDAIEKMIDQSCDEDTEQKMHDLILSEPGVEGLSVLQTRIFGSRIYVDAEIEADGSLSLTDAHNIAEQVHNAIEQAFPTVKHIMIHVNPCDAHKGDAHKA